MHLEQGTGHHSCVSTVSLLQGIDFSLTKLQGTYWNRLQHLQNPHPLGLSNFVFTSSLITSVVSPAADVPPLQAHVTSELALLQARAAPEVPPSLIIARLHLLFITTQRIPCAGIAGSCHGSKKLTAAACLLTLP